MPRDPIIGLGLRNYEDKGPDKKPENFGVDEAGIKKKLAALRENLKDVIYGQDPAIDSLVDAIHIAHAGLRRKDKPVGSFLFLGPTGSGKTELTVQLAKNLDYKFLRIDMSEFKHGHQIARLIGSPPGYVGFREKAGAGQLTSYVEKNPRCIILLDEIEKAHPDVYDLLLQVMDHGKLTDSANRTIDFSRVILVMTSNLGVAERERTPVGPASSGVSSDRSNVDARNEDAMRRIFSPEFRNRLDEVVEFGALTPEVIAKVVDKFVRELEEQLKQKDIAFSLTVEARKYLAANGFDAKMGARPLDRFITKEIRKKVAPEILFGKLEHGGAVSVGVETDPASGRERLSFAFEAAARPPEPESDPVLPFPQPPRNPKSPPLPEGF